jgi:hypothetical protein
MPVKFRFVDMKGRKRVALSKKAVSAAWSKNKVGMYRKATPQNRCRAGFRARKGSTTCKYKGMEHRKKDGSLDMRYNSSYK